MIDVLDLRLETLLENVSQPPIARCQECLLHRGQPPTKSVQFTTLYTVPNLGGGDVLSGDLFMFEVYRVMGDFLLEEPELQGSFDMV